MKRKTFDLIEAESDGEAGQFTALASVFGNKDLVGDRVMPGAFAKTLEQWRQKGKPIPIILSHQWDNPMAQVGYAEPRAVMETEKGLVVQGQLDVNDGNAYADQVYKLMKRGTLDAFSFGYNVPEGGERRGKDGANELIEVELVEIGPTLKGANPEAGLQAVKSAVETETAVQEPPVDEDLPEPEKVETVESDTPEAKSLPAKPAAKDPLRDEFDRGVIDALS